MLVPTFRPSARIAAAVAVGALALTGCGDESPRTTDATAPATGAAASSDHADHADQDGQDGRVEVSDAWVRATAGSTDPSMTGAFMAIDNEGESDVTLTGASSSVADTVEVHEMAMADGKMVMRRLEGGLTIRAGYGQVLMPGGNHVMLMGLTGELAPGDEVDLTLEFSDGQTVELTAPVKEFTEEEGHYHEDDAPHDHSSDS